MGKRGYVGCGNHPGDGTLAMTIIRQTSSCGFGDRGVVLPAHFYFNCADLEAAVLHKLLLLPPKVTTKNRM